MARTVSVSAFQQQQRENAAEPFSIDPVTEDAAATERLRAVGCGAPSRIDGADVVADLLHGSDDSDYPTESDVPCDECGGVVMLNSAEEDRRLASRVAEGVEIEVLCEGCAAREATPEPSAEAVPDAMTRLVARELPALNVAAECSEEMSLGMVIDRVRTAVLATDWGKLATDAEIVAEAERIWATFSDNRKGPREYTVAPDGTASDWRRPDTTPDRGDVTATHTLTDDEPRFSGAGAAAATADLYAVPADAAFAGRLYRDAPDLANIAERLIESKEYFSHLLHCEIRYAWKSKSGTTKRRRQTGGLKRGSDWFGDLLGADFGIWLAADTARERKFTRRHIERYLTHQLLRIGQDEKGNFVEQAPTLQVFAPEITEYADVADEDDKVGRQAFSAAEQMGLFAVDVDDEREDAARAGYVETPDGAGVLIHADGSPMTADEIAEMERRDLADDDDLIESSEDWGGRGADGLPIDPADPDGPSPEDDDDILADPKVI